MKFKEATKEQRKKHLKFLKWFLFIPLIILVIGTFFILIDLSIGEIIFPIGFFIFELFFIYFYIENLVVMWKSKHYLYFSFAIPFGILILIFYFSYYCPYLKGEKSFDEIENL